MHSHILPWIDDGSQSIETSLAMIKRLQEQGAKKIVLTPHYYSDTISLADFIERRNEAFNALKEALPEYAPELIPAAEVFITQYLFHNDDISDLCIGDSNYVLIEHPFSAEFDSKDYDRLMNLYCDYGVKPILAHIERYKALMDEPEKLADFIEMGCLAQVNVGSFANAPRKVQKKLFKYVNSGLVHLIGSDCHNLDSRAPEYEEGIKKLVKKCGEDVVDILIENANEITK